MVAMFLLNLLRIYDVLFCLLDKLIKVTALQIAYRLLHFNSFAIIVATTFLKSNNKNKKKTIERKRDITLCANAH